MVLEKFWLESKYLNQLIVPINFAITNERNYVNQELLVNGIIRLKHLDGLVHELLFKANHFCGGINIEVSLIEIEGGFSSLMQGRYIVNTCCFCCDKEEEGKPVQLLFLLQYFSIQG